MEKFARRCDITHKGMNKGWVWFGGAFYTSTKRLTIKELRKDVSKGEIKFEGVTKEAALAMTDDDLLDLAFDNNILYYTEWKEIDTDFYYDENGKEYDK